VSGANRTVIVVDDDRDAREMLRTLLELEGFRVKVAPNGLRLLAALHVDRPGAIVLDVRMSWIDGFHLCEAIKRNPRFSSVPIIFVSARSEPVDRERGLALGAIDYFTKPLDVDRFVRRLRDTLAGGGERPNAT
jgi:DNA-binding response OmpR family regulator